MKKLILFVAALILCGSIAIVQPQIAMADTQPNLKIEVIEDEVTIEDEEVPLADLSLDHTATTMKQIKSGAAGVIVAVVLIVCGSITVRNRRREQRANQSERAVADSMEEIIPIK